ncbi:hypothetical protein FUAX_04320 [Fulvitalea axinellae]|uniref:Glycosyl transferase family 1 domain-containing protein n=1 Tax=Fulvitalea axinellae TaxID=1182444 RepID=A0AAU9CFD6_9BACT|nr:hypothetical protein FUAX_04320 [Fulvitalea axinellae]
MKRVIIFLDELYHKRKEGEVVSKYSSGSFFIDLKFKKSFLLPVADSSEIDEGSVTTRIVDSKVYSLGEWSSVISFFKSYMKKENRQKINFTINEALKEADVVWVRTPSFLGNMIARQAIKKNKKVLVHVAGDIREAWKNEKYNGVKRIFAFLLSYYLHWEQKKIFQKENVVGYFTGSALFDMYQSKKKYFFVDTLIRLSDMVFSNKSNDREGLRLLFVGRLTEDKGIWVLLKVFEKLVKTEKLSLTIIGFGPEEVGIQTFIKEKGLLPFIDFRGFVPNHKLSTFFKSHDLFVMPSTLSEGFPRVIIEAWSYGLPVLSTRVGGIDGLGRDGENIIFCEKNSMDSLEYKINMALSQSDLLNKIKMNLERDRSDISYEYFKELVEKEIFNHEV